MKTDSVSNRQPVLGTCEVVDLPGNCDEPAMGYGMCHYDGGCPARCLAYVVPNAGPNVCVNCGHDFQVHW